MFELLVFAGVMAMGQFSPGPDMLLLTRTALAEGAASGVRMALGIATGLAVHASIAVGGTALILERTEWLKVGLTWVAAAYLIWLGWGLLREAVVTFNSGSQLHESKPKHFGSAFRRGLLCNLLNPKVAIFLAAVTFPFLQGERPGWWPPLLWVIIVGEGMILWATWACVLQWKPVREGYRKAGVWIDLIFGCVLVGLAVLLVVPLK